MEMLAFRNCMDSLLACGLAIDTLITDRHSSITKHMRENLGHIKHYFDLWHLKKSMIIMYLPLLCTHFDKAIHPKSFEGEIIKDLGYIHFNQPRSSSVSPLKLYG